MMNKLLTALALTAATQANAAALTVGEYFMLYQQNPAITAAYTAGVLDASRGVFWCHQQDPSITKVMQLAIKEITQNSLDPDKSADFAIVPPLMLLAPCQKKPNT